MAKLSPLQAEMLILIGDRSDVGPDTRYWVPNRQFENSETLKRQVFVYGGSASAIKALMRKGLVVHVPFRAAISSPYQCRITESGRALIESWRASGSWPVKIGD